MSLTSPALAGRFSTTSVTWEAPEVPKQGELCGSCLIHIFPLCDSHPGNLISLVW